MREVKGRGKRFVHMSFEGSGAECSAMVLALGKKSLRADEAKDEDKNEEVAAKRIYGIVRTR